MFDEDDDDANISDLFFLFLVIILFHIRSADDHKTKSNDTELYLLMRATTELLNFQVTSPE